MKPQIVTATLANEDIEAILAALKTVREKLPFLVGLSPADRRRLPKLGLRSQTFVEKALDLAEHHPEVMPRCLDVAAARQDLALFTALHPILQTLNSLQELVQDTQMLAGSEAYGSARLAYLSAKQLGKGMGLTAIVDDLARRFRPSARPATETPAAEGL
jgi:hypothetical protein